MIKYAIFDMDGTLIDSMPIWINLGEDYLKLKGIPAPENFHEILKPMSLTESVQYLHDVIGIDDAPEKIAKDINDMIEDEYHNVVQLKPYAAEYVKKLKDEGIPMCIATATPSHLAEAAMKRLGLIDYFEFIVCCDEVGAGKDKPDIFNNAIKRLSGKPEEAAVYDDAEYALITAKNAGFKTVGVYDDSSGKTPEEIAGLCDNYIKSFKELIC